MRQKNNTIPISIHLFIMFIVGVLAAPLVSFQAVAATTGSDLNVSVTRTYDDELSSERFFDIVFLTSRTVYYTLEAATLLEADDIKNASESVNKASNLSMVLKRILPVIGVDMTISDANGAIIKDHQEVTLNEIPIYQWVTNVKVVQPVMKFKKRHHIKRGVSPDEYTLLTQLWVDVNYISNNIDDARNSLDSKNKKEALELLTDALLTGIRIDTAQYGKELKQVIHALLQAYWHESSGKHDKAIKSLKQARKHLVRFTKKEDLSNDPEMKSLIADLDDMIQTLKAMNAEAIKSFWFKIIRKSHPEL